MSSITETSYAPRSGDSKPDSEHRPMSDLLERETQQWILACHHGDGMAWDALIRRYQPDMYRYAYSLCRNREDASDVVAQALLRLYQSLPGFREQGRFITWLFCIVRHCFYDLSIRPKYRSSLSLDTGLIGEPDCPDSYEIPDPAPSPETLCLQKVAAQAITEAIRQLPAYQQEVIRLYCLESKSYEEIGQVAGLSLGTVKSRISRARKMVRARLVRNGWC